jgi:hypothetical protein
MDEVQRSVSLDEPTDIEHDIYGVLYGLLRRAWERRVSVRLAGLKLSKIYDAIAAPLPIDREGKLRANHQKLAGVIDQLRHDLGPETVMRGHDLWLKQFKNAPREDLERTIRPRPAPARAVRRTATFVPLDVRSHYSFCDSLLPIPRIIELAQKRGITALALTDPNLHGAVEFSRWPRRRASSRSSRQK